MNSVTFKSKNNYQPESHEKWKPTLELATAGT
jgi:hypothetical protein